MKRIGNFLFIEQWFEDHEPEQAIININKIDNICSAEMSDYKQHSVIETPEGNIAITGDHNDNIIELSKLLSTPNEINVNFDDMCDL